MRKPNKITFRCSAYPECKSYLNVPIKGHKSEQMILPNCDFKEFIEAIKDKGYMEIVCLANREATDAERFVL